MRQESVLLKKLNDEKDFKIHQLEREMSETQDAIMGLMTKTDDMSIKMEILNRETTSLQKQLDILQRNKTMSKRGTT